MKVVGITGGVGSGKSYITRLFALHQVPILDADSLAKSIMKSDPEVRAFLHSQIGPEALRDGDINKEFISKRIFENPELRIKLNEEVHPRVAVATEKWLEDMRQTNVPYAMREAAIMVESGSYRSLDLLIAVFSPKQLRIERLGKYRGYTLEKTESIMDAQLPDEELAKYADFQIFNNEEQSLILQVENIDKEIRQS